MAAYVVQMTSPMDLSDGHPTRTELLPMSPFAVPADLDVIGSILISAVM